MIYVPLYDTLGEPAIIHIINQSMSSSVNALTLSDRCRGISFSIVEDDLRRQSGKRARPAEDGERHTLVETNRSHEKVAR